MWTPLPLVAALALTPAQPGTLALTNPRNTHGELGGVRQENAFLPGDVLFVGFDIEGLAPDAEGKVSYSMGMELKDKAGKSVFKQAPAEKVDFVPLGGGKLPARAYIIVGHDQPPGEYALTVTVADPTGKASQSLERKFEIKPKDFGIVAVYTSVDDRGQLPAPTTGVVGQSVWIQFAVTGFARDPKTKQPNVAFEMVPLDEAGKPTLAKPNTFTLENGVKEEEPVFNVRFLLPLTRAGKFTVRLKATDKLANKSATFDLPVAVVPSAN